MNAQPAAYLELTEVNAERAMLGTMFEHPDLFGEMAGDIDPAWFGDPLARYMFESCIKLVSDGNTLSTPVIISMLPEDVGGQPRSKVYSDIRLSAVPRVQIGGVIATLKDRWARRQLLAAADGIKAEAATFASDPFALAMDTVSALDSITASSRSVTARRVSIGQAAEGARDLAEDRARNGVVTGVTWGLRDLDDVTKLYPGELTICAARPSMGKTTLGLHTCLSAAKDGTGVLFVSLEMGEAALGQRVLSAACWSSQQDGVPYSRIRDGQLTDEELERLSRASERLADLPLVVEQEGGLNASQIAARARAAAHYFRDRGQELGLLVIDHLGLIAPPDRYAGARHLELGAITTALKSLAKEMGVPVLLLCHLSRGLESR
jgi:replicative DNA helicase